VGTTVGVLILAVLVPGGALLGWTESNFQVIKGTLLLLALAVAYWASARSKVSGQK
jgi:ribose/xylose/arabinose/galactoside ABC-type transport system permease subunit